MTAEALWAQFKASYPDAADDYEAWAFGDDADKLAGLVLAGVKSATASAYPLYALLKEPLPKAGEYSVILDSMGKAVCVIRTTKVSIVPFDQVSQRHAYLEGEGDRSLAYWREVHKRFFTACLAEVGETFDEHMLVVCEEFELIYR